MSKLIVQVEFNRELYDFLKALGYTHIQSLGALPSENDPEGQTETFRLQPLRADDQRLKFEETEFIIEPIESNDVLEMVHGDEFILFVVELPFDEFELFFKM